MPSSTSSSEPESARAEPAVHSRPPRGGPPWALLLALALFALAERGLWSWPRWLTTVVRYAPPGGASDAALATARVGLVPARGRPVVLLGSSQVREGIDCAAFDRRLPGQSCHNLAVSAGAPLDLLVLDRRLDARAPQRVTVVAIFPKVLHTPVKAGFVDSSTVRCLGRSGAWAQIGWSGWRDVCSGLLQDASPTLRAKDGLRQAVHFVQGRWAEAWAHRVTPAPARMLEDATAMEAEYFAVRMNRADDDADLSATTLAHEEALRELAARATATHRSLVVVDFPTRPGYETTVPSDSALQYARLLAELRAWPGLCVVPSARLGPLTEADFLDFTHLGPGGRAAVSARLAEAVDECQLRLARAPAP